VIVQEGEMNTSAWWRVTLVHRLAYNSNIAAGQLAVFQGAGEAPISEWIRVEQATRKNSQLTCGPDGYVENGPAATLLVGHISI
jgi:hypothetical protein